MLIGVFYQNRTFKNAFLLGAAVICFQMTVIQIPALGKRNAFIIFHKSRQSLIGLQTKQQLEIHHTLKTIDSERIIKDYIVGASIKKQCDDDIQRLYQINDKCLLVVDSLGFYSTRSQTPQWILLRQSPKINLDRLIDSLNPELIIWDGSNYRSDQERWKLSCKTKKIPFHQTSEKGAFIVSY
jgi:competence protein ComEC